jgi:hypothetical protein
MFLFEATRLGTVYLDSTMNEQPSGRSLLAEFAIKATIEFFVSA